MHSYIFSPTATAIFNERNKKAIAVSLAVHIVILALFLFRFAISKQSIMTSGPIYSVNIVSTSGIAPMIVENKKNTNRIASIDPSTLSAFKNVFAKSVVNIEINKAVDEIKKKLATTSGQGKSEREQASDLLASYYGQVEQLIKREWNLPPGVSSKKGLETIVSMRILRDGTLAYASFEKNSGNHYLDESAMRAVKRATPFPTFPDWLNDNYVEIGIKFNPTELK